MTPSDESSRKSFSLEVQAQQDRNSSSHVTPGRDSTKREQLWNVQEGPWGREAAGKGIKQSAVLFESLLKALTCQSQGTPGFHLDSG